MKAARPLILCCGLLLLWQLLVLMTGVPAYILPGPLPVAQAMVDKAPLIAQHAGTTLTEILLGLLLGTGLGSLAALAMHFSKVLKQWMLPVLVVSQAIPVFALAPLLVLWLGYGMASKVGMAVLIIFFPVTQALYAGMGTVSDDHLELARIMNARPLAVLRHITLPAALPTFASGLRVATAVAPIGAVVGEWVGSSSGLGFLMLHANARMQIPLMFAALTVLAVLSLTLYFLVDLCLRKLVFWQPNS